MLTSIRNVKFYKNALEYNVYHRCIIDVICYLLFDMLCFFYWVASMAIPVGKWVGFVCFIFFVFFSFFFRVGKSLACHFPGK